VSEPTKPSWADLSAFLTLMQIARLRMLGIGVDIAEPAEFYGDMSGQTWEHIPVEPQHRPD
jgi:hypothetical protein